MKMTCKLSNEDDEPTSSWTKMMDFDTWALEELCWRITSSFSFSGSIMGDKWIKSQKSNIGFTQTWK